MSQADGYVKSDKIKALAVAKECYAMRLELLTNATVVDGAIRFVASHAAVIKNSNSDKMVTIDEIVMLLCKNQDTVPTHHCSSFVLIVEEVCGS